MALKRPTLLAVTAALWLAFAGVAAGQSSQEPAASVGPGAGMLCPLTPEELSALTGMAFETVSGGGRSCHYEGANAAGPYLLDVRFQDADLRVIAMENTAGGADTEVRGFPAWVSDDGIWVEIDDELLVVQPILFFSDATVSVRDMARSVAESVLERLGLAAPAPAESPGASPLTTASVPPPTGDVASRFPAAIAGQAVEVVTRSGAEMLAELAAADSFRSDLLVSAITAMGRTVDDLSEGRATIMVPGSADTVAITALRLAGAEAARLMDVLPAVLSEAGSAATNDLVVDERQVREVLDYASEDLKYLYVTGDVVWIIEAEAALLPEILRSLP